MTVYLNLYLCLSPLEFWYVFCCMVLMGSEPQGPTDWTNSVARGSGGDGFERKKIVQNASKC